MTSIEPFLTSDAVFEPEVLQGMAKAFDCVCRALDLGDDALAREAVAIKIIALARFGERDPGRLYEKVLSEKQAWLDGPAALVPVVRISRSRSTIAAPGTVG